MAPSNLRYDNSDHLTILVVRPEGSVILPDRLAPPTYNEVIQPETVVPPTYESLYGSIVENDARSGFCDTFRKTFLKSIKFCKGGLIAPLLMFVAVISSKNQCGFLEFLSLQLIIGGSLTLTTTIFEMFLKMCKKPEKAKSVGFKIIRIYLKSMTLLWLLLVTTLVYAALVYEPFRGPPHCQLLYIFRFWLITAFYFSLAIGVLVFSFLDALAQWLCS